MSKEIFLKSNDLRLLYYRYKDTPYYPFLIISLVFFVSTILFFQVVIPQIQNWFSISNEVTATQERIDVINQNINFMSNIDKTLVEEQLTLTTTALPFEKDFGGILNAITDASTKAGVGLDDYSFQLGNIASVSGQQSGLVQGQSFVKVTVEISGSMENASNFLKEITTKLPLSEIIEVNGELNNTTVTLQFYQKPFPQIVFRDDQLLLPLSPENEALLTDWESWVPISEAQFSEPVSSESALPLF